MRALSLHRGLPLAALAALLAAGACSATKSEGDPSLGDDASTAKDSGGFIPPDDGGAGFDVPAEAPPPGCTGIRCNQVKCGGTTTTTVTGTVYAPNGTLPLYNVIVYVPNLKPLPLGK